jgi:hypothetical protein
MTLRDLLKHRNWLVAVDGEGDVHVIPGLADGGLIDEAACAELTSALEDAIQSGELAGYTLDEESGELVVAGHA